VNSLLIISCFCVGTGLCAQPRTLDATLNGLRITLDSDSGSILRLYYPGVGVLLEATPKRSSVLDLATPIKSFEPLRLASRYSKGVKVTQSQGELTLHWEDLGASRSAYPHTGHVSATVKFTALPDSRSIAMNAEVQNDSPVSVRQVLFPDFLGLLPFCGEKDTFFRSAGSQSLPFIDLAMTEAKESSEFMEDFGCLAVDHRSGSLYGDDMILRWMDFGGLRGGFSVFPKAWGWDPQVDIRLQRSEVESKLRMSYLHYVNVANGGHWKSPVYVMTPHRKGWAAGIVPFQDWVRAHFKREFPIPKHVKEGLGFRSIWMSQNRPDDPSDAIFRFSDLPKLAQESKAHGLDELVFWAWSDYFTLPLPSAYSPLGGDKGLAEAARECKHLGVNLTPFISVELQNAASAPRYGAQVQAGNGWTYHTELIPRFNPPYANGSATVQVGPDNPLWQKDALAGTSHLAALGLPSICWDQLWTTAEPEPNQMSLVRQIRERARWQDPEATFGAEQLENIELDGAVLDYTWNWQGYIDCRPLTSVLPAPRINCNVSSSPLVVRKAFADNLYLNVMPRRPESVNGSDWIANRPAMSKALRQCAMLRRKFIRYFSEGRSIGDGILTAPCPGSHVTAYALPDRVLVIVINTGDEQRLSLHLDAAPWVTEHGHRFRVTEMDANGHSRTPAVCQSRTTVRTPALAPGELEVVEMTAIQP
jgi:hypothetical protein